MKIKSPLFALGLLVTLATVPAAAQITAESENNNTEGAADGPLGSGVNVSAQIGNNSDVDWYYFDVASAGNINITLSHTSPRDFDFFLYKPTGSYVLSGQSSARPETGTYYATDPLRYFIKVTRYAGSGAYTLNVTFPGGSATPIKTATPTPTATATPTPTATATITPTSTPTPTPTGFGPRPTKPSNLTNYLVGNSADSARQPVNGPAVLLMGGSLEVDAAFANRAYPVINGGDIVVLRTDNSSGYQTYLYDEIVASGTLKPDSVETLILDNATKANSDYAYWAIRTAEMVFIAGGDQSAYLNYWKDTQVEVALTEVYNRGGVIGGTSAGNHVMGEFIYDPDGVSAITGAQALANPYASNNIISSGFLTVPLMDNIITDTHFAARTRMGRPMSWLARLLQDGTTPSLTAVAVDERTSIFIDRNRVGYVDGTAAVYILWEDGQTVRQRVASGQSLIYNNVLRTKLTSGGSYNFNTKTGSVAPIRLSVNNGTFTPSNPY